MNEVDYFLRPNPDFSKSVSIIPKTNKLLKTCCLKDESKVEKSVSSNRPILICTEETVNITLKHDGAVANFCLRGVLSLHLFNDQDRCFQLQIETGGGDPRIEYNTPSLFMDTDLYFRANILGRLDYHDPWPAYCSKTFGTSIFTWKMPNADDVPLKIRCLHSVSGNQTSVNLQYEASSVFQLLQDVVISIPIPALQEVRSVKNTDGEWRHYSKKRVLEWSITCIDDSNCRGSLAFGMPLLTDIMEFSPISVQFTSTKTFSDVKVVKVLPLRANDPPEFFQRKRPTRFTESFQLV